MLARDVGRQAGHRADARRRRGHHDRAAAAPGDLRHDVLHAQPHAADVDGDDPVEVLLRLVLDPRDRSEEHTSELQSLMRISYAVFCLKKKKQIYTINTIQLNTYN